MRINVPTATDARETADVAAGSALYTGLTSVEAREARLAFHRNIHTRPQPGCPDCPPTPCPCGALPCKDVAEHLFVYGAAETTWRAA